MNQFDYIISPRQQLLLSYSGSKFLHIVVLQAAPQSDHHTTISIIFGEVSAILKERGGDNMGASGVDSSSD